MHRIIIRSQRRTRSGRRAIGQAGLTTPVSGSAETRSISWLQAVSRASASSSEARRWVIGTERGCAGSWECRSRRGRGCLDMSEGVHAPEARLPPTRRSKASTSASSSDASQALLHFFSFSRLMMPRSSSCASARPAAGAEIVRSSPTLGAVRTGRPGSSSTSFQAAASDRRPFSAPRQRPCNALTSSRSTPASPDAIFAACENV
jgi:hypothetical protein